MSTLDYSMMRGAPPFGAHYPHPTHQPHQPLPSLNYTNYSGSSFDHEPVANHHNIDQERYQESDQTATSREFTSPDTPGAYTSPTSPIGYLPLPPSLPLPEYHSQVSEVPSNTTAAYSSSLLSSADNIRPNIHTRDPFSYESSSATSPLLTRPSFYSSQPFRPHDPPHYHPGTFHGHHQLPSIPNPFPDSAYSAAEADSSGTGSTRVLTKKEKPQCWEHGCNGRTFSTFSNLLRHQREKSGTAAKAQCPKCHAEFTRTTARNGHMSHDKCKPRARKPSDEPVNE